MTVKNLRNRTTVWGLALVVTLLFTGYIPVAMAQEAAESEVDEALIEEAITHSFEEEVTVTGTLIPRPNLESLSPVAVLNVEEITYSGVTRIEDLMATMPQAFSGQNSTWANGASGTASVNLRNIGSERTLVLINGRRMAPGSPEGVYAPDLNIIPASMLKRVDVLTGGASSTYGNDAVAGVVNFVIDQEFEGMRGDVQYSFYNHSNNNDLAQSMNAARGYDYPTGTANDGDGYNVNLAFGGKFADGRGHASAYIGYRQVEAAIKGQRDYLNCSAWATEDGPLCGGSATTDRGTFVLDSGDYYMIDPNLSNGENFVPWDGYRFNYGPYNHIQRPDERFTAGAFLNYEFNEHAEGYMELMFMNDETDAQIAPSGAFGVTNTINCDNPMMSDQQRETICGQFGYGPEDDAPMILYRRNVEGDARSNYIRHTNFRIVTGVRGDISDAWSYDAYGLYAQTNLDDTYNNDLDITRIADALDVVENAEGEWVCRSGNDGCVPWNVFTPGGVTQEATDYIKTRLVMFGTTKTQLVNGVVTGDLEDYGLMLPSATEGMVLALGTQFRSESLERVVDETYRTGNAAGQGGPIEGIDGRFSVSELYTEILLPIVQDRPGFHDLSMDLGYRYSDYSTSGGINTYKVMLSYAPTTSFNFRGGFNRAIRAPNIFELFTPAGFGLGGSEDPCAGPNPSFTEAECANTGVLPGEYGNVPANPANQYNDYSGGSLDLVPESADTLTFGVVITPDSIPGLSVTLDYYDIQVTDLIDQFAYNDVLTTCAQTGDEALCGLIHRGQDGNLWYHYDIGGGYIETNQQNVGNLQAEGVDLSAAYTFGLGNAGFLSTDLMGTYTLSNSVENPLRAYDCVGYFGYQCGQATPEWQHRFRATWETNFKAAFSLMWRYIGNVQNDDYSPDSDLRNEGNFVMWEASGSDLADAYNYFDLAFTYNFTDGIQFSLGVNNILSEEPPMWPDLQDDQYVNTYATYDPLGRFVHTSLRFNF